MLVNVLSAPLSSCSEADKGRHPGVFAFDDGATGASLSNRRCFVRASNAACAFPNSYCRAFRYSFAARGRRNLVGPIELEPLPNSRQIVRPDLTGLLDLTPLHVLNPSCSWFLAHGPHH